MIAALTFENAVERYEGRRIRGARFTRRSSLPVSAACVVASGVRETLCAQLGARVNVRLLEPVVPDPAAWELITADAMMFRVRAPLSDAALILRRDDALGLVGAVFGERPEKSRPLSPIEDEVLARVLRSLAATLSPVCGAPEKLSIDRTTERTGFVTYFELLLDGAIEVRIGVALTRDPQPAGHMCLRIEDLLDVELELTAEFATGDMEAAELLLLQPNTTLRMKTKVGAPAVLKLAGRIVARGECGALGGQSAFAVADGPKGGSL
ncbi:MAG: FliM/FliN family flagellar motor switch protein [Candidatus Eremiobacteraeota bacterium]|nr:FliM/FliN family flagellar motor switch protein [Candidatus Eremiobacteraeota bacterium]